MNRERPTSESLRRAAGDAELLIAHLEASKTLAIRLRKEYVAIQNACEAAIESLTKLQAEGADEL